VVVSDEVVQILPETESSRNGDSATPPVRLSPSLPPVVRYASGVLTNVDMQLLHHYQTVTWRSLTLRNDQNILSIHQNLIPRLGMTHPYLLYAVLSITASHTNSLKPSVQMRNLTDVYRQRTITAYNRALSNINSGNYESLLTTSLFMQCLLSYPEPGESDDKLWEWLCSFMSMQQGLRILCSLKWAATIQDLSVAPVFHRELKTLPPAPEILMPEEPCFFKQEDGGDAEEAVPLQRNQSPPMTYDSTFHSNPTPPESPESHSQLRTHDIPLRQNPVSPVSMQSTSPPPPKQPKLFLPPPLLDLLETLARQPSTYTSIPMDIHTPVLLSALHPLPPIFLSLYYFRISPDLYARIVAWPTFLGADFTALIRSNEPRALIILAWWFALLKLVPNMWWLKGMIEWVMDVIERKLRSWGDGRLKECIEGAARVVRVCEESGRERGAREFWKGWDGVEGWPEDEVVVVDE